MSNADELKRSIEAYLNAEPCDCGCKRFFIDPTLTLAERDLIVTALREYRLRHDPRVLHVARPLKGEPEYYIDKDWGWMSRDEAEDALGYDHD